jgi:hypothetical protein
MSSSQSNRVDSNLTLINKYELNIYNICILYVFKGRL